jgi:hypothetical protein
VWVYAPEVRLTGDVEAEVMVIPPPKTMAPVVPAEKDVVDESVIPAVTVRLNVVNVIVLLYPVQSSVAQAAAAATETLIEPLSNIAVSPATG